MHIGLFFGSFNPIHIGHLIIAKHFLNEKRVNEVWFLVSPQNPFKSASGLLNEYHRLHLVTLSIEDEPGLRASNIEFNLPKPSYTVETLAYLKDKYPEHQFSILMGSDGFQNLPKWKNAETLIKQCNFLVYKRPGFDLHDNFGASVIVEDAPALSISSTHIRQLIRSKKSIRYLVTDAAKEEIEKNNYYMDSIK